MSHAETFTDEVMFSSFTHIMFSHIRRLSAGGYSDRRPNETHRFRGLNYRFLSVWKLLQTFMVMDVHNSTKYTTEESFKDILMQRCYIL